MYTKVETLVVVDLMVTQSLPGLIFILDYRVFVFADLHA